MKLLRLFQTLVVISTLSYMVWFFFPDLLKFTANDVYHEIASRLGQYNGFAAVLPVHHPLYQAVWFALWLVASVGLFFLQNWSRHLFLSLYIVDIGLSPLTGFSVQGPLEKMFYALVMVLDGAVLAIAYLSALAHNFQNRTSLSTKRRRKNSTLVS